MNIIIFGTPGSGKGTQAKKLAEKLDLEVMEVGELLRGLAKNREDIAKYMERGELLPDNMLFELVTEHIEQGKKYDNLIFDGYPRSAVQLYAIKDWLEGRGGAIDMAIYLKIRDEVAKERMKMRGRDDDTKEAVGARFAEYHKVTEPLIGEFDDMGILVEVNGEGEREEVFGQILSKIKAKNG